MKSSMVVANVLAWAMACAAIGEGAEPPTQTVVSIKGLHCAACATKVTKKLQALSNVKSATVDSEKGTAVVVPMALKDVSSRAIWEAVESAGYKPVELKGPSGTYKEKPAK